MAKHFEFADFVQEFAVSFTVTMPGFGGAYVAGRWVPDPKAAAKPMTGMILPFGPDDWKRADNGGYTERDRKVYVTEPLTMGTVIDKGGERYTVDRKLPYDDYADVFIYYAKGAGK